MSSMNITVTPKAGGKKILIEMDANKFEKLAGDFGFFSPDFIKSLERAEKDFRGGRIKKISSLKDLKK